MLGADTLIQSLFLKRDLSPRMGAQGRSQGRQPLGGELVAPVRRSNPGHGPGVLRRTGGR